MTDIELLELAAKAEGRKTERIAGKLWVEKDTLEWNPLTDDGDALRLAVKLGMTVQVGANVFVYSDPDFSDHETPCVEVCELTSNDPYAATRRAIVRAAAEIGKEMK